MKSLHLSLTLAALLAASAVQAQTASAPQGPMGGPMSGGMHMHGGAGPRGPMMDPARMQQRAEERLAALKQVLQLDAAQETAWSAFAGAMRPASTGRMPVDRDAMAKLTTPERIERMKALRDQRHAEMDRRAQATLAFYGALNAEQKKRFDDHTAKRYMGHRGHHGPAGAQGQHRH